MNFGARFAVLAVLAGLVAACPIYTIPPEQGQPIPPATTYALSVNNMTGGTVCYIYVSPCESTVWGDDILGTEVLPSGSTTAVRVQPGCWDLKAEDCSGNILATQMGVQVNGDSTWALHPGYY